MRKTVLAILMSFLAGASAEAGAQVRTPPVPPQISMQNQLWRNFRMAQIGNQLAADMARSNRAGKKQPGKTNRNSTAAAEAPVYRKEFSFGRTSESPLARKLAEARGDAAPHSDNMFKMRQFVGGMWRKYEDSFADERERLGMPRSDVVSAMTYYVVISYLYAHDLASLDSEYSVAVYRQLAGVMAKDARLARLPEADKQLLAELLVTMGGMPAAAFDQKRDKEEQTAIGLANLERVFGARAARKLRITAAGIEF